MSKFLIRIHPIFAILKQPFDERLNYDEVQRGFWIELASFLSAKHYSAIWIDSIMIRQFNVCIYKFFFMHLIVV